MGACRDEACIIIAPFSYPEMNQGLFGQGEGGGERGKSPKYPPPPPRVVTHLGALSGSKIAKGRSGGGTISGQIILLFISCVLKVYW